MNLKEINLLKNITIGFLVLCFVCTNVRADKEGQTIAVSIGTAGIVPALVAIPATIKYGKCKAGCTRELGAFSNEFFRLIESPPADKALKDKVEHFSGCLSNCSASSTMNFKCNVFNEIDDPVDAIEAARYMVWKEVGAFGLSGMTEHGASTSDNLLRNFFGLRSSKEGLLRDCRKSLVNPEKNLARNIDLAEQVSRSEDYGYALAKEYQEKKEAAKKE